MPVTALDWAIDNEHLQSNAGLNELIYCNIFQL